MNRDMDKELNNKQEDLIRILEGLETDENETRARIRDIFAHYRTSFSKLAGDIGSVRSQFQRQLNAGSALTYNSLMILLKTFPEVSAEWLMRGEGGMIKTEPEPQIIEVPSKQNEEDTERIKQLADANMKLVQMLADAMQNRK